MKKVLAVLVLLAIPAVPVVAVAVLSSDPLGVVLAAMSGIGTVAAIVGIWVAAVWAVSELMGLHE
jgi:hypothetical protein